VIKKSILGFVILALAVASAATSYQVIFHNDVVVNGSTLKAGEYRVEVKDNTATIKQGKTVLEARVKVENNAEKFSDTSLRLNGQDLAEIRVGGTHTLVVFEKSSLAAK
jgi:ribosomal protein S4